MTTGVDNGDGLMTVDDGNDDRARVAEGGAVARWCVRWVAVAAVVASRCCRAAIETVGGDTIGA